MKKKILLLSPYDILSHQYWWQGLQAQFPEYQWTVLTLPPRYFSWRIRGNSLSWAFSERESLQQHFDLLIACSMTDLSSLRGFIPELGKIPTLVYCHENQFLFPQTEHQHAAIEAQILQIYTLLCADKVIFNSCFNRDSFFKGARSLLKKLPDNVPKNVISLLENKSLVIPVPLQNIQAEKAKNEKFTLVWNHRWEYDKGLQQLLLLIEGLCEKNIDCRFHLIGQHFRNIPESLEKAGDLLKQHKLAGEIGFIENKKDYFALLSESHLVLSTSLHEFQGLAIMEAVLCGCIPLLPDRLSYPEFFDKEFLYASFPENPQQESASALEKILFLHAQWQQGLLINNAAALEKIPTWENEKAAYQELISSFL